MRLKRFQILSMLDMWLLLLRLQMVRFLLEFMVDYESRKTITLGELMPLWWGEERARQRENKGNE